MQINNISKEKGARNRVKISAQISYADGKCSPETCWYDFPEPLILGAQLSGNPWLAAFLPLAMTLGEPLQIFAPVDRTLFEGARQVMEIWHAWYPSLPVVPVEAELVDPAVSDEGEPTAAFFSGGADSFFTLLRNAGPTKSDQSIAIDDLLLVWGFDVSLDNEPAFQRMRATLRNAAAEFDKELTDVATNLRQTRFQQASWGQIAHGAALASVGLHLENRYRRLLIPSSGGYKELLPWGSHVLTDPLFSTRKMRIMQDGAAFSRGQKLEYIAGSPVVQRHLHVCWRSGSERNCGRCGKCLRAMIALEVLGFRKDCSTFPSADLDLSSIARIYYDDQHMIDRGWDLHNLVVRKGRPDIAKAIRHSLKRSLRLQRWHKTAHSFRTKRLLWRWSEQLEQKVLAGSIL